jgi:hypothetical protein
MNAPLYDSIGGAYAWQRRPDPRIAALVTDALGDARRIDPVDGTWDERYGHLRTLGEFDSGLRLVVHRA